MFRRIVLFLLFLVATGVVIGAAVSAGISGVDGPGRWLVVGLTLLILAVAALAAGRMFRRVWAPLADLVQATERLGDGETGVRLRDRGPRPFLAVTRSFNTMAERLEEEDERRRRLLADLGHELRTPLTVIRGEIEAVIDGVHGPESLSNVTDEVELMERLLEDLRLLALAEAGRLQLHREETSLAPLVESVLASFRAQLTSDHTEAVIAGTISRAVHVDPHRIHQVIANLVANAADQTGESGRIEVGLAESSGSAVVTVSDDGPGIPAGDEDVIFERFTKAADSTGTGLGLSIARDLIEAHGGTLTAGNGPDGGAIFTIDLPWEAVGP